MPGYCIREDAGFIELMEARGSSKEGTIYREEKFSDGTEPKCPGKEKPEKKQKIEMHFHRRGSRESDTIRVRKQPRAWLGFRFTGLHRS